MGHWAGRRGSLRGGGTAMSRPPAALSCSAAIWTPASSRRSWSLAGSGNVPPPLAGRRFWSAAWWLPALTSPTFASA